MCVCVCVSTIEWCRRRSKLYFMQTVSMCIPIHKNIMAMKKENNILYNSNLYFGTLDVGGGRWWWYTDYGGHMSWHHLHENRFGFHQQQRQQQQHNILYVATCVLVLIWKYPKIDESQHFGDVSLTSAAFSLFLSSSRIFLPLQSQRIACYSTFSNSIHTILHTPVLTHSVR